MPLVTPDNTGGFEREPYLPGFSPNAVPSHASAVS